jgi:hypothetical protein
MHLNCMGMLHGAGGFMRKMQPAWPHNCSDSIAAIGAHTACS